MEEVSGVVSRDEGEKARDMSESPIELAEDDSGELRRALCKSGAFKA